MNNLLSKIKQYGAQHAGAIALALLTALIAAGPQIWFRIDHRSDGVYQGVELLPDSPWSARAREVMDGHPNLGAIYYQDSKDDPYLFQPLGSMTVAYLGRVFGLDINNTILLARLVLSFVASLIVYAFVFSLYGSRIVALAGAAVLLLGDSAQSFYGIKQLFHGMSPDSFLRLSRPINPGMIYLLFFGALTAFWQFFKKHSWQWGLASAVLIGLNFYNYFYAWTFLYAFGGVLTLMLLLKRELHEAARITGVFVGALIVAIPYVLNLYSATLHPAYAETGIRFGMVATHAPLFVGFIALGAIFIFLLWFPRESRERYLFSLALLLTPIVTMNQQIVTGKVLQATHYHWFMHKPIAVVITLITLFYLVQRYGRDAHKKIFAGFIIGASIAIGAWVQYDSYYHDANDGGAVAIERQKYGPVLVWLNNNASKEAVVFANNEASHLVVIYTPLNVFYHRAAMYSLAATTDRLLDVLFTFYRLRGVEADEARDVFYDEREEVSANIYGMHYRELLGSYAAIPDAKLDVIIDRYEKTLSIPRAEWIKHVFAAYNVEYVIWDINTDPLWDLDQYRFLTREEVFDNLVVYSFRP